ncbi:hypothetical protein DDI_1889 [Dickeya dianthicola RNS04.9]|nr:hypothetical protein DDI_1889 [Dickeya dianthicola RNS04.9]
MKYDGYKLNIRYPMRICRFLLRFSPTLPHGVIDAFSGP